MRGKGFHVHLPQPTLARMAGVALTAAVLAVGAVWLWGVASTGTMPAMRVRDVRAEEEERRRRRDEAAAEASLPPGATDVRHLGPGWVAFRLDAGSGPRLFLGRYYRDFDTNWHFNVTRAD